MSCPHLLLRNGPAGVLFGGLLGVMVLALGCAGSRPGTGGPPRAGAPIVAVLPFDNLSERTDAGEVTTRIFVARLSELGAWRVIESGEVEAALEDARVRNTSVLTYAQIKALGERLRTRHLLVGTVLENTRLRTSETEVPAIGVALRLISATTGEVEWTEIKFRSGDDRETLFGWGRTYSAQKLTADLAEEMLKRLPRLPAEPAGSGGGELQ